MYARRRNIFIGSFASRENRDFSVYARRFSCIHANVPCIHADRNAEPTLNGLIPLFPSIGLSSGFGFRRLLVSFRNLFVVVGPVDVFGRLPPEPHLGGRLCIAPGRMHVLRQYAERSLIGLVERASFHPIDLKKSGLRTRAHGPLFVRQQGLHFDILVLELLPDRLVVERLVEHN